MRDRYFTWRTPPALEPSHRELCVEAELASGSACAATSNRLDVAPAVRPESWTQDREGAAV